MTTATKRKLPKRVTGRVLQQMGISMLPFYRRITNSFLFASQWTTALRTSDLIQIGKLLNRLPKSSRTDDFSLDPLSYLLTFPFKPPVNYYSSGLMVDRQAGGFFQTSVHRRISRFLIPFYRKLATCPSYAEALAVAICSNNLQQINRLIRRLVTTKELKEVSRGRDGVILVFQPKGSKFPYEHWLMRELR
ncbi:hypothetical protein [Paenibacillus sp. P46E]|uniref:hypothetical protein n=1 Tax=Paenibacillus sp. P46E TaxID=1349436 RepID=UPI00093EB7BE|nr:hypothetical protein [Paenibacillus sp. P46E]